MWVISAKGGAAVVLALVTIAASDPIVRWVGLLATLFLAGVATRDAVLRVRVEADADGVNLVHGLGRRHFAWSQLEQITIYNRRARGIRADLLEFDAGDEILQFGHTELGVTTYSALDGLAALCPDQSIVRRPEIDPETETELDSWDR
jgi:hypothetical protein